jgi:hypothetical protein
MCSTHVPLLKMDDGIPGLSDSKRDLCGFPAFGENGSDPRLREMTPSNKNDIFHTADPQASLLSEPHTAIDIFDHPFTEISERNRVLSFCGERKI